MTTNAPSNQHYIPQFVLRNFRDQHTKKLQAFNKDTGYFSRPGPRSLFSQNDRYTMYSDGGHLDDYAADNKLTRIESDAAPNIRTIIDAARLDVFPALSPSRRDRCKRFYVHSILRIPEHALRILKKRNFDDAVYEGYRRFATAHGLAVHDRHRFDLAPEWTNLKQMLQHNYQARVAAALHPDDQDAVDHYVNNWELIVAVTRDQATRFVIGGCAVMRDSVIDDNPFDWLPVAPDVAISIRPTPGVGHLLEIQPDEVDRINAASFAQSRIVATRDRSDLERVIALHSTAR